MHAHRLTAIPLIIFCVIQELGDIDIINTSYDRKSLGQLRIVDTLMFHYFN
jgi:hypothetical protein